MAIRSQTGSRSCFRFRPSGHTKSFKQPILALNDDRILRTLKKWVVVVAQLAKRSLPTPEVRSSNPVIGKVFIDENKEQEADDFHCQSERIECTPDS